MSKVPGFFQRMLSLGRNRQEAKSLANPYNDIDFFGQSKKYTHDIVTKKDQLEVYQKLSILAACAEARAIDASNARLFFTRNGKELTQPSKSLQRILDGVYHLSSLQVREMTHLNMVLAGEYLWHMRYKNLRDNVEGSRSIDPFSANEYQKLYDDTNRYVAAFRLKSGNIDKTVDIDECIWFNQSALGLKEGIGGVGKSSETCSLELLYNEWTNDFLQNGSFPSATLTEEIEGNMNEEEYKKKLGMLRANYRGSRGDILYFLGKNTSMQQMQISMENVNFVASKKVNRDDIYVAMGVPPIRIGLVVENSKADSGEALKLYYNTTVNRDIRLFCNAINHQYLRKVAPGVELTAQFYQYGMTEDVTRMIGRGMLTPADGAKMLGLSIPTDENARKLFMEVNVGPIDMNREQAKVSNTVKSDDDSDDSKEEKTIEASLSAKDQLVNKLQSAILSTQKKYQDKLSGLFAKQQKVVLSALEASLSESSLALDDVTVDFGVWDEEFRSILKSMHTSAIQKAIRVVNEALGGSVNPELSNPFVSIAISTLQQRFAEFDYNGVSKAALERTIKNALLNDWNITQIRESIEKSGVFSDLRAATIARTESQVALDKGTILTYQQLGVKNVDVVGCTQFEPDSDCGATNVPIEKASSLRFHPQHLGVITPSEM